jgi:hypothetical protein
MSVKDPPRNLKGWEASAGAAFSGEALPCAVTLFPSCGVPEPPMTNSSPGLAYRRDSRQSDFDPDSAVHRRRSFRPRSGRGEVAKKNQFADNLVIQSCGSLEITSRAILPDYG